MDIKVTGPAELLEAMVRQAAEQPGARVDGGLRPRSGAQQNFSVNELVELLGNIKDLVELATWLWGALQLARAALAGGRMGPQELEVVTTTGRVRLKLPADATVEQIAAQLSALGGARKP